ncbi:MULTISPECIES: hypothetical protein [unclassified Synechococcus]|uniref:hypothetical protein n=1 Tax=unclassified Synechococcus TaxID=2626047 RepID=UPI0039AEFC00
MPGSFHVVFASDFSVRGGHDPGFSQAITWDTDLLSGYPYTVLQSNLTHAPQAWKDLDGRGLAPLIKRLRPNAILLNSLTYRYDITAYFLARRLGIPLWMRCEIQDEAVTRSVVKGFLRSSYYRLLYSGISKAFTIGQLNRKHWLRHGLRSDQLRESCYCTPDRASTLSLQERENRRTKLRHELGLSSNNFLFSFFGKLIPKKDPSLLLQSAVHVRPDVR